MIHFTPRQNFKSQHMKDNIERIKLNKDWLYHEEHIKRDLVLVNVIKT